MKPANLLFILSDQHQAAAMGCAGHPLVQTPSLGSAGGLGNALQQCLHELRYLCSGARRAWQQVKYVHQIGNWDNGIPL